MGALQPKRAARPPPRLRVKTGCQTCLKRRKKCPENRPICSTCERLGLDCVYRTSTATAEPGVEVEVGRESHTAVSSSPAFSLSVRPSALRTQRDWNVFTYCSTKFMSVITSPGALSKYRSLSMVFKIGYENPWVLHAALAPAALHASFSSLITKEEAVLYAHSALQGLRQSLLPAQPVTLRRDPCLSTSLFLGTFEDFYSLTQNTSLTHYQAIAQILEAQFTHSPIVDYDSLSVLQLTLLDATLYHLSTRLIMEKDVEPIWEAFPFATMPNYVEAVETKERDMHGQPLFLPVLGRTPPALLVQICQLTWLSRQLPLELAEHSHLIAQSFSELDRIRRVFPVVSVEGVSFHQVGSISAPGNSELSPKLYFVATQIFCAKVANPEHVTAQSPDIKTLLKKAVVLLKMYDAKAPCGQFICWPILVLGCAACPRYEPGTVRANTTADEAHLLQVHALIRDILLQIWSVSYSGYVQRTLAALEKIWSVPEMLVRSSTMQDAINSATEYDGLNALIHKDGLGAHSLLGDDG